MGSFVLDNNQLTESHTINLNISVQIENIELGKSVCLQMFLGDQNLEESKISLYKVLNKNLIKLNNFELKDQQGT